MMGGMVDTGHSDGTVQRHGEETPPAPRPEGVADLRQAGVSWPDGQALARFAPPTDLDVLDLSGESAAEVLLATAAQGVVYRSRPRIWLLREADEGSRTWLDTLALPGTPVGTAEELVRR